MESLKDILKGKPTPTNTSRVDTDISSGASEESSSCPLCRGAGFVYARAPRGHPDFGKALPCQCTRREQERSRLADLERYSNLGPLTRLTFDKLIPRGRRDDPANQERFERVYRAARDFAQESRGWLVLLGPSGCGKTHLAAAIANERLRLGQPALFAVVPDLLDHLRATFSPSSEVSYDELFEKVKKTPLLILDDLGTQSSTPWAKEKLFQILNHRYNSQLPTVVTTNVPLEEMEERLGTRLFDPAISQVYLVEERQEPSLERLDGLELELLRSRTFENFDLRLDLPPLQRQNLEQALRLAKGFAESPDGWLSFQGANGCGKTHLAAAIANYRRQAGKPALLVVVAELLDYLRSTFSPESKVTYDELFERVKKAPLLILDDFGKESSTSWAQEKLYQIINYRYNARLATVITTCLALEEIESHISSRMVDPRLATVFNITVPDYQGDSHAPSKARFSRRK